MSSFGAAQAASAEPVHPVADRETLWTGGIVTMKVPPAANMGCYPKDGDEVPYLQFPRYVRGGVVNVFVHTDNAALRGTTITAGASIMKKTMIDGREYLYVDLVPVDNDVAPTHFLDVVSRGEREPGPDDLCFETLGTVDGLVILSAPKPPKPRKPPKPKSTGDTQLDRLIQQGWTIDRDEGPTVHLSRMAGDKKKTMVHRRRRPNRRRR